MDGKNRNIKAFRTFFIMAVFCWLSAFVQSGCSQEKENVGNLADTKDEEVSVFYRGDEGDYDRMDAFQNLVDEEGQIIKQDVQDSGKIIITLQDAGYTDTGVMSFLVAAFNRDNDTYQVQMERFEGDVKGQQERLKIELAAGRGPDIMTMSAIPDAPLLLDKGCFVNLSRLMERSGLTDELFFPAYKAFTVGERVYALCPDIDVLGMAIRRDFIGAGEIPDMEALVDRLLNYPEDAIFENAYQDGADILEYYFLAGSEDLFGMIDWENRKCDFTGELFSKMLDVAKRYADVREKGYDPLMRSKLMYTSLYPGEEILRDACFVTIDYYFDDGNYPLYHWSFNTMLINSNTQNLEGAWAFLSYAMTKTGQSIVGNPVSKEVFEEKYRELLLEERKITEAYQYPLTEQTVREMKYIFETGKYSPIRTQKIIDIIVEETGGYFSGEKTKEAVIDIIQNRVQLYLSE